MVLKRFIIFQIFLLICECYGSVLTRDFLMQSQAENAQHMHHPPAAENILNARVKRVIAEPNHEQTAQFWNVGAQLKLKEQLLKKQNHNQAKNVIFFLGDGMSIPTLAASRMYYGQQHGRTGEESQLFFETFPDVGLSKTYCVDKQVADSACTATAYLSGVKANYGTIGVTAAVQYNECKASTDTKNHVQSIMSWAQQAGKGTGIVTTTRVTHASPAGTYAHVASREWESDTDVTKQSNDPIECQDIASQLIHNDPGKNFKVILGGGRNKFLPITEKDEQGRSGHRSDGVNLITEWLYSKPGTGKYVFNKKELMETNFNQTEYLLGLFESDHMKYNLDSDHENDPSLADLTYAAVKMMEKESQGYVLFIEGGRIDHAHHETKARKSLDETVQFSEAVLMATALTKQEDTLIVVTADHAHTMSLSGYSSRGNDILGLNTEPSDADHKPYTTLSYANGPGKKLIQSNGERVNLTNEILKNKDFQYPKIVPLKFETHGGDDVAVFALGPWSHLFTGLYEQNFIPHAMAYAACMGYGQTACKNY